MSTSGPKKKRKENTTQNHETRGKEGNITKRYKNDYCSKVLSRNKNKEGRTGWKFKTKMNKTKEQ